MCVVGERVVLCLTTVALCSPLLFISTKASLEASNENKVRASFDRLYDLGCLTRCTKSTLQVVRSIIKSDGASRLYDGLGSALLGNSIGFGCVVLSLHYYDVRL